ncbi:type VI secretion system lipoprotein TssJ [Halopseudomonas bauzanensis]|uniref:Type VI secretion system lipoprotein TssJ n=1 Tax=Halopseudomonas bauzanensis TaxID=653930 RepID=A0A4V6WLL7_9GAMM|nr:type VI secretion system lipoprotein TssJ [Halopseudomonas bauzanensis]TKA92547.1 type VI secretion system lipoprotein TssJ [Halopseudomonas bauzanensis]
MPRPMLLLALCTLLALSGCSPFSSTTKLDLTLEGSPRLNPDINDRPSPIVVRLIELRNPVAFENTEFFSLYQRPREVLTPDLVSQEELELRPGDKRSYKLSTQPESRYIGVLAAYRNLPEANWRYVIPLKQKSHNQAELYLDARGISTPASTRED